MTDKESEKERKKERELTYVEHTNQNIKSQRYTNMFKLHFLGGPFYVMY